MKASEFDKKFDEGKNILTELDPARVRRPEEQTKRINVDFPGGMLASRDREGRRLGVTRQSIIKMWLAERLHQGQ